MATTREQILVEISANDKGVALEFGKMARAVEGFGRTLSTVKGAPLAQSLSAIAKEATGAMQQARGIGTSYGQVAKKYREAATAQSILAAQQRAAIDNVRQQDAGYRKLVKSVEQYKRQLATLRDEKANLPQSTPKMSKVKRTALDAAQDAASKKVAAAEADYKRANAELQRTDNLLKDIDKSIATAKAHAAGLRDALRQAAVAEGKPGDAVRDIDKVLKGRSPTLRPIAVEVKKADKEVADLQRRKAILDQIVAKAAQEEAKAQELSQEYAKQASHLERINRLRSQNQVKQDVETQTAKRLTGLQAQTQQAMSKEVSMARVSAEAMKRMQDIGVRKGADKIIMSQATAWQKLGLVMRGIGQVWTKNNLLIGSMGAVLTKNSGAASVTTGNLLKLGNALGVAAVSFQKLLGLGKKAATAIAGVGRAVGGLVIKNTISLAKAIGQLVQAFGRVGGSVVGAVRGLGNYAAKLVTTRAAQAAYKRQIGQTVDAEGWHSQSLKGLVGNAVNLNRWVNTLGSGVRQLGQAFQNAGMTMSMFLSYPAGASLKGMWNVATEFDKSLIEIRKNADVTLDYVKGTLGKQLLDVASESPTPLNDIGKIAADAARLGIPPEAIADFTRTMDMLVVSTNLSADEATDSIGRIMTIFTDMSTEGKMDVKEFSKEVMGLGSAINELGQANPISETELVAAALRVAPAAKAIGMELEDMLGLAASVASASASPERAGTQLATALSEVAKNLTDISFAGGMTVDEFSEMWNNDPTEMFLAIADAIAQIDDPLKRSAAASELFGAIGGKATNIIGAAFNKTAENVALSRKAFEDGTSLAIEFSRAMDAVSNQTGLLKNQFNIMAVTLGEAFLPVMTTILSYVIPVIQTLTKYFATLSDQTKLMIVGFGLFAAVIGPVVYAIGSLMFSAGIMVTGLTSILTVMSKLITAPLGVIGTLMGMVPSFRLIGLGALGVVGAMIVFQTTLASVLGSVATFAQQMYVWGYNAFMGFAGGIYEAAQAVFDAVYSVLEGMARMLESFSPPKEGPLKDIDKWGKNLATTFADSFAQGDLSGVITFTGYISSAIEGAVRGMSSKTMELFGSISSVLESIVGSIFKATGVEAEAATAGTQQALSQLVFTLKAMQDGGNWAAGFKELAKYTGAFSKDFEDLVGLQVKYNEATDSLEKVKEELEGIDKATEGQVRSIAKRRDISIAERIAMIRQAKITSAMRKEQLTQDQAAAEKKQAALQEEIDYRKQIIELLQKLMPEATKGAGGGGAEDLDKAKEKAEELDDRLQGLDYNIGKVGQAMKDAEGVVSEKLAKMAGDFGLFTQKISAAKEQIRGFIDALLGRDTDKTYIPGMDSESPDYWLGYTEGWEWRQKYLDWLKQIQDMWMILIGIGSTGASAFQVFSAGVGNFLGLKTDSADIAAQREALGAYGDVLYWLGQGVGALGGFLMMYGESIKQLFFGYDAKQGATFVGELSDKIALFAQNLANTFGKDSPLFTNGLQLAVPLMAIGLALSWIAGLAFDQIPVLGTGLGHIASLVLSLWGAAGALASIGMSLTGVSDAQVLPLLVESLKLIGDGRIAKALQEALKLGDPTDPVGVQIVEYIYKSIVDADWSQIGSGLAQKVNEALFGSIIAQTPTGEVRSGGALNAIPIDEISKILSDIVLAINSFITSLELGDFGTKVGEAFNGITEALNIDFTPMATNLVSGITSALVEVNPDTLVGAAQSLISAIVIGMYQGIMSSQFDTALSGLASALIGGLAALPWATAVSGIAELATKLVTSIAEAPWGDVSTALTSLLNALLTELAKPALWAGLGSLLGNIGGSIASGILEADWNLLFNSKTMGNIVDAFIEGFLEALKERMPKTLPGSDVFFGQNAYNNNLGDGSAPPEYIQKYIIENQPQGSIPFVPPPSWGSGGTDDTLAGKSSGIVDFFGGALSNFQSSMDSFFDRDRPWGAPEKQDEMKLPTISALFGDAGSALSTIVFGPAGVAQAEALGENTTALSKDFMLYGNQIREKQGYISYQLPTAAEGLTAAMDGYKSSLLTATKYGVPGGQIGPMTEEQATETPDTSMLAESILAGFTKYLMENSAPHFNSIIAAYTTWLVTNMQLLDFGGRLLAEYVMTGVQNFIIENYARFTVLLSALSMWIGESSALLAMGGGIIANHVITGMQTMFAPIEYWNAITTSFGTFVDSVGDDHAISAKAIKLGKKISQKIGQGVKDNWKAIADGISEAVQRAIDSVKVETTSAGAPPASGGAATTTPTSGRSIPMPVSVGAAMYDVSRRIAASEGAQASGSTGDINISITIQGDAVIDDDKRMNKLADVISRKIGRNMKYAGAFG